MWRIGLGRRGETAACRFLKKRGYKVLDTNYRCPLGEIDVVALHKAALVFLEVKSRTSDRFGTPQGAVTAAKQKKLAQVAKYYLKERGIKNRDCRFDVVAVRFDEQGELSAVDLIENAFLIS